ncbi:DUF937 domain-containing protein [[Phormidium ambiguum] IAM M-71]|uniref:DUF937 domain-containing protein n=1 Tax=[Phormidium ambiguum] IAM M-71 TaxID=454136 RepID=A0A1U7IT23_9CYAN|nr:DUF937 domain-containing protein [Phormidium ambiguum]OKH40575.1 DUF937 domain-containing protein [Phormidium ambiguum IAM M-71]
MGLFFDILSSINNPNQQGNVAQLESIMNTVNQLSATYGIDASQIQTVMSSVGNLIRPVLQQNTSLTGGGGDNLLGQFMGAGGSAIALQSLLTPEIQQQMVQVINQTTGLSPNQIQAALPTLISTVMSLLNMGASKPGIQGGGNPLLNAFLDADKDGDADLGDVMKYAGRFLNPPQAA